MKILVTSKNYPSPSRPNYGAFVYNLVQELANYADITVIAANKKSVISKKLDVNCGYGEEKTTVIRPNYISFSNMNILGFNTNRLSVKSYSYIVSKVLSDLNAVPDIIYCHFLSNAVPMLRYAKKHKIPLVVASGESTYAEFEQYSSLLRKRIIEQVSYIICVSSENKKQLEKLGFEKSRMNVIPNAVDYNKFKPSNKSLSKEKLGIDPNIFVVGFVGHFIHRKGPNRIIQALKKLNNPDIKLVCVGDQGGLEQNEFTIELGKVPNYRLPEIYDTFDVFVLPTLHEGSCNVIEEAKATAVPVISSKGTSVEEQIDESTGVLVDPMNINEIAEAINKIKSDKEFRMSLVDNLNKKRGSNSLQNRALKIMETLNHLKGTNN